MERVGVRELRQNISVYLRRVARGEALEVTDHGRPSPFLPLSDASALAALAAAGRLQRAAVPLDDLPPPVPARMMSS